MTSVWCVKLRSQLTQQALCLEHLVHHILGLVPALVMWFQGLMKYLKPKKKG
ncbi:hypothetical protein D3C86_2157770 [compost metagenome]